MTHRRINKAKRRNLRRKRKKSLNSTFPTTTNTDRDKEKDIEMGRRIRRGQAEEQGEIMVENFDALFSFFARLLNPSKW